MTHIFQDSLHADLDIPAPNESEERNIKQESIPEVLSILPLKNTVLFPGVVIPITVGRDKSIQLVKDAYASPDRLIGVVAQLTPRIEDPTPQDLFPVGTLARIHKLIRMPDGSITIVIQGRSRIQVQEYLQAEPYFRARVEKLGDVYPDTDTKNAMILTLKQEAGKIIDVNPNLPSEAKAALNNITSLSFLVHFIASNLNIEIADKQRLLELHDLGLKGQELLQFLNRELKILTLSEEIHSKVRSDLDKQQRDYFLRQQMKAIQDELGDDGGASDIDKFRKRASEKVWPERVQEVFEKELAKLNRLQPTMPDYAVVTNYLEWLLDLPWGSYTEDRFDFKLTREILESDHYGLEKVKDRILEFLAVLKLKGDKKAPILLFYGPPGVGKTSLGKSIAKSLGREFVRISLGGVRDEAEIRGHRRTYIGAMPGRIIQGLKRVKSGNPVFMLDEIDKVGADFRGDPSSALLEVLDPEQNNTFQDHFMEVEYDLSKVMFIATANSLSSIHPALRDRMEIIEINGYSAEEKLEIAKRHLVPDLREEHGLTARQIQIGEDTLRAVIDGYTRESGVRNLAQKIGSLCRGVAKELVINGKKSVKIQPKLLEQFLGIRRFEADVYQRIDVPGVAVGLAWTPVGGDILFIEASLHRGAGKLSMTGKLGDVMKESAMVAFHYLRAHAERFGISPEVFKHWDIHLHFPAGAISKDGPSAGIAILTAMASIFSQRLTSPGIAMTGEITLRGKVLPVGGIKEKLLAAARAGIKTVVLCRENRKDVSEIKSESLKGLDIRYVERMEEVLELTLEKKTWPDAIRLLPETASAKTPGKAAPKAAKKPAKKRKSVKKAG